MEDHPQRTRGRQPLDPRRRLRRRRPRQTLAGDHLEIAFERGQTHSRKPLPADAPQRQPKPGRSARASPTAVTTKS